MGVFVSRPPKKVDKTSVPVERVQVYANLYAAEYQKKMQDPVFAQKERAWFASIPSDIRSLPIEEQAQYADYVGKCVCQLPPDILTPYLTHSLIALLSESFASANSSAVANTALFIVSLPDGGQKEEAKQKFARLLK